MGKSDMIIEIQGSQWEVFLYDNASARALQAALPQTISLDRWGDEYYGRLPAKLPSHDEPRELFDVGEVALWPPGNAFCIFFGPTPASTDSRPRMASPGFPLGRITKGDPYVFQSFGATLGQVRLLSGKTN